ncbi:MAG: beta-ketoacyl synthase N-terminal-like domain-containing protein [Planctomycetota bacterium]
MKREVYITGVGPVCGLGLGIDTVWPRLLAGETAIGPMQAFDATHLPSWIAAEVHDFKIKDFVPKTYRKATKVMARDIELAVAAAQLAAQDAGLKTHCTAPDEEPDYDPTRFGCHIGAGLIAADVEELTAALVQSQQDDGSFNIAHWGEEGMGHLTPLWLLKYLPNMLACHVTIVHDAQGPSNTITCAEASGGLSLGESLRVIQRGQADACFCGGAESNVNPMSFIRQVYSGRLSPRNDDPAGAVRPFDQAADGTVVGEGGGILVLEAGETMAKRDGARPYAKVLGFGASQSINPAKRSLEPTAEGRGPMLAIRAALRDADLDADAIDAVIPFGCGHPIWDAAEAAALHTVFGDRIGAVPVVSSKASIGNCSAGAGALDLAIGAKALREQTLPRIVNRDRPINGMSATQPTKLEKLLVFTTGFGGQNTAAILEGVTQ